MMLRPVRFVWVWGAACLLGACGGESIEAKADTLWDLERADDAALCDGCFESMGFPTAAACEQDRIEAASSSLETCVDDAMRLDVAGMGPFLDCAIEAQEAYGDCLRARVDKDRCPGAEEDCFQVVRYSFGCDEEPGIPREVSDGIAACMEAKLGE